HGEAGAVDHASDVAVELDVVEAVLGGFDFERVFFVKVAQAAQIGVAKQAVVVEGHFCVESNEAAIACEYARVDFEQRSVGINEGAINGLEEGRRMVGGVAGKAE